MQLIVVLGLFSYDCPLEETLEAFSLEAVKKGVTAKRDVDGGRFNPDYALEKKQ